LGSRASDFRQLLPLRHSPGGVFPFSPLGNFLRRLSPCRTTPVVSRSFPPPPDHKGPVALLALFPVFALSLFPCVVCSLIRLHLVRRYLSPVFASLHYANTDFRVLTSIPLVTFVSTPISHLRVVARFPQAPSVQIAAFFPLRPPEKDEGLSLFPSPSCVPPLDFPFFPG